MSDQQVQQLARALQEAINSNDADRLNALYDEHVVQEIAGLPTVAGREAIRHSDAALFRAFPDHRREWEEVTVSGNYIVLRWRATGTHTGRWIGIPPTNRWLDTRGCTIVQVRDGRITHVWIYPDGPDLMRQLGLVAAPTPAPSEATDQ